MYSEEMYQYGAKASEIREIFAYGLKRKQEIGEENVFDFSLGNPSTPPPKAVTQAFMDLLENQAPLQLHGYTPAVGDIGVREAICQGLNKRFNAGVRPDNIYMTCGAAAALKIILTALFEEGDEALTFTPFFPEYTVFAESTGYKFIPVATDKDTFQIDPDNLEKAITKKTKCILINSPNNPSGVIYTRESLEALAGILKKKEEEYAHPIFLISDEPYRELVYEGTVPYIPNIYNDTVVCYSYSKSLSLPGDRIGYLCISDKVTNHQSIYAASCGAGRALGYVCAPSILQKVVERCAHVMPDVKAYRENRDLLYNALTAMGYSCIHPDGAFYLCVKSLEADAGAFAKRARDHELLIVPGDSFYAPGYVRISYCVTGEMIERALPAFEKLYKEYRA